ncbi:MAG: polysaccharide deacetylase family protein [Planctomycetota bacterium]
MSPELAGVLAGGGAMVLGLGGLTTWSVLRPLRLVGVPVLRYRIVGAAVAGSPLNEVRVPMSRFEPQMRYLAKRGFRAVTLSEALLRVRDREFLASNPVSLSFDGPYRSFLTEAWPVMRGYGLDAATVFFPPARLGQAQLAFRNGRPEPLLSAEELAGLAREGVELGVQAGGDDDLPGEELTSQLTAGRRALTALAGRDADAVTLSFTTKRAVRAAQAAGFKVVAGIGDGIAASPNDAGSVPRFPVMPDSTLLDVALVVSRRYESALW